MPLPTFSPDTISAMAAIGGAIAVKLFEKFVSLKSEKPTEELREMLHKELDKTQKELDSVRGECAELREELQKWQTKYWKVKLELDSSEHKVAECTNHVAILQDRIKEMQAMEDTLEHEQPSSDDA